MEGRNVICVDVVVNNPAQSTGEKSEGVAAFEVTPGLAKNIKQNEKKNNNNKINMSNKRLPTDVKRDI